MILVTGAAGVTGLAVIRALAALGAPARALVHRHASEEKVRAAGAAHIVVGDLRNAGDVERAMRGVEAVYHICPNMCDAEIPIGQNAIAAALGAHVERFVYHSVILPGVRAMPHHWDKARVEQMLAGSGLRYTVLQPAAYMQNVHFHWRAIMDSGVYPQPCSAYTRLTLVDLEDVAQAAALALTGPGWPGATFALAGPAALSRVEMARIIGEVIGRPVRASVVPIDEWRRATEPVLGLGATQRLAAMFEYYDRHGLEAGSPDALAMILGRAPTGFRAFVERIATTGTTARK